MQWQKHMRFLSKAVAITCKDVLSEVRARETIPSVLIFAVLVIVIFNFAFGAGPEQMKLVVPGILWTTFVFAGMLSLNRTFIQEKEQGCLEALMICPVKRQDIYIGKTLANFIFLTVIEAISLPIFVILFNLPIIVLPKLIVITILATIGFISVGTLFAALSVNTKAREMVLPILFLPVVVPVILSAVEASALALTGESWSSMASWLQIIAAFDVIFMVVSYLIFEYVIEE
ncbi:MAG: heme exporter protein CcmB [Dehalococcoidales bacterium]|nr:heme exporter protein CcmB [Dehalococcoidales bacterium]